MIFDAHLDMAWNACDYNRNLMLPVAEIRQFEKHLEGAFPGPNTVSWPELRRGGVGHNRRHAVAATAPLEQGPHVLSIARGGVRGQLRTARVLPGDGRGRTFARAFGSRIAR